MLGKRCSLCGGKLDHESICIECGLDNSKSDAEQMYNQEENKSYRDYFLEEALKTAQQSKALAEQAKADGADDAKAYAYAALSGALNSLVEVGGGIRTEERIQKYLALGAARVILGTVAVQDFAFTQRMAQKYGGRIAVGVDAKDGKVATHGWLKVSLLDGPGFCGRLAEAGVKTVVYTDIARDGAEQGANLAVYRQLCRIPGLRVIASGGVSSLAEIRALADMGAWGAILGKALYTGRLGLAEALKAAGEPDRDPEA